MQKDDYMVFVKRPRRRYIKGLTLATAHWKAQEISKQTNEPVFVLDANEMGIATYKVGVRV